MARPNGLEHPRLGVVVSKRVARQAVARNYMKRVVREVFRLGQQEIASLDIVARVHKPFEKKDFAAVREDLLNLFASVEKCLTRSYS
jgi:ribonuclease P protein component